MQHDLYAVHQPGALAILLGIAALTLLGSAVLTYVHGWKSLPVVFALMFLLPMLVVGTFGWLTYRQNWAALFDPEVLLPLGLVGLPSSLLGIGLAFGFRRWIRARAGNVR